MFFICMGMLVDMQSFTSPSVLGFAMLLTLAAILGKLGLGVGLDLEAGLLF
jgi:Kef-type K+ transport system membrane component KefB